MNLFDRVFGWYLVAIATLTPLIVFFPTTPPEQQSYFLMAAILLALALLGIGWMLGWRRLPSGATLPIWLAGLLAISGAISIARSSQPMFSLQKALLPICGLLYLGLLAHQPRRAVVLRRATFALAIVGTLMSLLGILQYFGIEFLPYSQRIRKNVVIATIGHPNFLGSVLGPMIFLMLSLVFYRRREWTRYALPAAIFLALLCIALARTRAVWLGVLVGILVLMATAFRYSLLHRHSSRMVYGLIGGIAGQVIVLFLIVLVVLPAFGHGIDLAERLMSEYEIKSRLYYWNTAIDLGRQHPWFGIGFAMFDPNFWDYALAQQQSPLGAYYYDVLPAIAGNTPEHVHNEYLEVFTEQGYFGLVSLLAFLLFFVYFGYLRVMRVANAKEALRMLCIFAALAMVMIDAMFGFPWRLPVSLMVTMILLAWLYDLIYPQPLFEPEAPEFS